MSDRYQGGVIRAVPLAPTSSSASGIWTMEQQAKAQAAGNWPSQPLTVDPYFNQTSMLLGGEPANSLDYTAFSDASSNNFLITPIGNPYGTAFSPYNSTFSNYFDGTGDYLQAGSSSNLALGSGDFTVECWAWLDNIGNGAAMYSQLGNISTDTGALIYVTSATGNLIYYQGGNRINTTPFPTKQWNHVAAVRSSGVITLYLNGVSTGTYSSSADLNSQYAVIGRTDTVNDTNLWTGYISNLRVVPGTAIYTSNFTPPTAPLTAVSGTALLTCQSNRFIDNSGNAFTITANGNTSISGFIPFTDTDTTTGSGYFNGSSSYISTPYNSALALGSSNFTIEAWVNTTQSSSYPSVIGRWSNALGWSWDLRAASADNSAKPIFVYNDGSSNVVLGSSGSTITDGAWHHLAAVRNGSTITLYVDGVSVGTSSFAGTIASATSTPQYVGYNDTAAFNGYISNARIVVGTAVYTSNFTPPTAPLTAVTNTQLLTLQDRAANQNFGFLDTTKQNLITAAGNATQGTFSPFSQPDGYWSTYFDGTDDFITVANNAAVDVGTGVFTIEMWFYPLSFASLTDLSAGSASGSGFFAVDSSGGNGIGIGRAAVAWDVTSSVYPNLNTWNHIAFVRDSSNNIAIFLNGTRIATGSNSNDYGLSGGSLYVGKQTSYSSTLGYISNYRMVKGSAVYDPTQTTCTVPTTPLTAISNTSLLTLQSNRYLDNSANAFTVTPSGNLSTQSFGPFAPTDAYSQSTNGGSYYGDGSGDYLKVPKSSAFNLAANNSWTLQAWIYPFGVSPNKTIMELNEFGNNNYLNLIAVNSSGVGCNGYVGTTSQFNLDGSYTWSLKSWHHMVAVCDGTRISTFVNGNRINTTTSFTIPDTTNWDLYIGAFGFNGGTQDYFNGYISDAQFANGAALYDPADTTITVPTAPLTPVDNTSVLCNFTNAGVWDSAARNDLETAGNATLVTSESKFGSGSYYFDGSGDGLVGASRPYLAFNTGAFTLEAWVYLSALPGALAPIADINDSQSTGRISFYVNSSGNLAMDTYNAGLATSSGTVSTGQWVHVAFVRSSTGSNGFTFYINGTASGTATVSLDCTNTTIYIGRDRGNSYSWSGYIDDFRITNGVARYTENFTPANYPFPVK